LSEEEIKLSCLVQRQDPTNEHD